MKLVQVWNSAAALKTLSALKKPPKLAYRLRKYEVKVQHEIDICQKQNDAYIYEVSGAEVGSVVRLEAGTPENAAWRTKFNDFLSQESSLEWAGITMDDLIDALDAEKGNVLSEEDIGLLEPFFEEPKKPDLKVVA